MAKSKIKILNSKEGYDLVAKKYDEKEKYLASFEQGRVATLNYMNWMCTNASSD
jgi:hypothetical protein